MAPTAAGRRRAYQELVNHLSHQGLRRIPEMSTWYFIGDKDWTIIPPHTKIDRSLIFKQNLRIKKNCVLDGDVKTHQKLVLEEGVSIKGNVFAENGISAGPSTRIYGNVFSQEAIYLGKETKIGRAGTTKSVVARKEIALDSGVVIYGYVVAGKRGRVL